VTIPKDHISFNDDGTEAWIVFMVMPPVTQEGSVRSPWFALNRPCDMCQGTAWSCIVETDEGDFMEDTCPDCIDGRHTFTIEVEQDRDAWVCECSAIGRHHCVYNGWREVFPLSARTYRVSVIPGMVLKMRQWQHPLPTDMTYPCLIQMPKGYWLTAHTDSFSDGFQVPLPPAAAPGIWAVKLKVAQ
jgi:hypothetical protein